MFCKKCGAEIKGTEKFCPKCGTPLAQEQGNLKQNTAGQGQTVQTSGTKKKIPYLAIGVLVILAAAAIFVFRACASGNYETPIKNMVKGIEKQDANQVLSALPDEFADVLEKETGFSKKELANAMELGFTSLYKQAEGKFELDYEIMSARDMSSEEIKELKEDWDDMGMNLKIKEGKEIDLKLKFSADDKSQEEEETIQVIKIGSKWYLNPNS